MSMSLARIRLKGELLITIGPRCDLCGRATATDLHELLLERDEANSSPELLRLALECWQNCTVLCNACNIGPAKQTDARDWLISKQISRAGMKIPFPTEALVGPYEDLLRMYYGTYVLSSWLCSLPMKDPRPYLRRLARISAEKAKGV